MPCASASPSSRGWCVRICGPSFRRSRPRSRSLVDPPPTALFASQNLVTIGAIRALRQLGKHHEIALVGFDDFMLADLLEPAVSVIAQDPGRMGGVAAQTLFDRLGGEHSPSARHVIPTWLIERGSGEIAPALIEG